MGKGVVLIVGMLIWIAGSVPVVFSQTTEKMMQSLVQTGFEDVRVGLTEETATISIGNVPFRWQVKAIAEALDQIVLHSEDTTEIQLILTDKDIPVIQVNVNSSVWEKFRNGVLTEADFRAQFRVSHKFVDAWKILKEKKAENRRGGKIEIVGYPQLTFKNTLLRQPFEIQLNVAPVVKVELFRGMVFTGQVIFPLVNELGYEGDFIRPGYLTLMQEFCLPGNWRGRISGGNFSASRYGLDFYMEHYFFNNQWKFEVNSGFTGSSHFLDNRWVSSEVKTFTWLSSVSYYYPKYNLKLKIGAAKYIYNDFGAFANCIRYFGETTFGFYLLKGNDGFNGGFSLSFPIGTRKRGPRKTISLNFPRYFEMTYDAGTEFRNGQTYGVNPTDNRVNANLFTDYILNEIIHLKK